ncbi:hypothetical protein KZ412_11205, partial [Glaesserella parasuis]|nr:hypothetical protein [Glaesserella parasuis]
NHNDDPLAHCNRWVFFNKGIKMTLKKCLLLLLLINLNPIGLWLNSFAFNNFFNDQPHYLQEDKKALPECSSSSQIE